MRRVLATLLAALLTVALAAPVMAVKPVRGCPTQPGWSLISGPDFYAMSVDNGFPPLEGAELDAWYAGFYGFDRNGDGSLCFKEFQPTVAGAFPPYFWNVVDNVSNH